MKLPSPIVTERLQLRSLTVADASSKYVSWLNDSDINRFLESRFLAHPDRQDVEDFIRIQNESAHSLLLGIFLQREGRHIGNIKLGPIVAQHRRADVGFLIGDKSSWGFGYATEAISAVSQYGLKHLGLEKITAGCYATNLASSRALAKAGFSHDATLPNQVICEGRRIDSWLFGFQLQSGNEEY